MANFWMLLRPLGPLSEKQIFSIMRSISFTWLVQIFQKSHLCSYQPTFWKQEERKRNSACLSINTSKSQRLIIPIQNWNWLLSLVVMLVYFSVFQCLISIKFFQKPSIIWKLNKYQMISFETHLAHYKKTEHHSVQPCLEG